MAKKRKIKTASVSSNSRRIGGSNSETLGANEDRFVLSADLQRQANRAMDSTSNLRRVKIGRESGSDFALEGSDENITPAKTEGPKLTKKKKKKGKVKRIKTKGKSKPTELDAKKMTEIDAQEALRLRTENERLRNALKEREIIESL